MQLLFEGKVIFGDPYRCNDTDNGYDGAVFIGEEDVVDRIYDTTKPDQLCKAYINGKFIGEGQPGVTIGWGYSEWTPMEQDELKIGDCNLIEKLREYEGEEVKLSIVVDQEGSFAT